MDDSVWFPITFIGGKEQKQRFICSTCYKPCELIVKLSDEDPVGCVNPDKISTQKRPEEDRFFRLARAG